MEKVVEAHLSQVLLSSSLLKVLFYSRRYKNHFSVYEDPYLNEIKCIYPFQ